jgi:DNA-binding PadR family transcriptional regulator
MVKGGATRLFILSRLAEGLAHGHQIRRDAQAGGCEVRGNVAPGSIYAVLARLEADQLIRPARSERAGRFPERTIYALTAEGRKELKVLRAAALREVVWPGDPFDLALSTAGDMVPADLLAIVEERLAELRARRQKLQQDRRAAGPNLERLDRMLFDHLGARLDAEIQWHDRVRAQLPEISA